MARTPLNTALPGGPLVDSTGNIMPAWRSWFLAMMARTGGTAGTDASGAATAADLAAETSARNAADSALSAAISAEASTRATADTAEAATRAAADAYFGGQTSASSNGAVALETAAAGFGTKISAMPAFDYTTATGAEVFPTVQGAVNFKWPLSTLYTLLIQYADFLPNPLDAPSGSASAGQNVLLLAGTGDGGLGGGEIFISGGIGGDGGNGGDVTMSGGAAGATSGDGGDFRLSGGGAGDGSGGNFSLTGGNSGTGATGVGGSLTLTGGNSNATDGDGGDLTFQTGGGAGTGRAGVYVLNGMATADPGIPFSLWADNGVLVQSGFTAPVLNTPDVVGDVSLPVSITTGTTDTSASGTISATTGDGSTGAGSGDVLLTTGTGQDTGRVQLTTGTAVGTSGNINVITGDGDSSGTINFAAGTATGGGGVGGSILFQAGVGATPGDLQFVVNGGNVLTNNSWPTADPLVSGALWIDPVTHQVMASP